MRNYPTTIVEEMDLGSDEGSDTSSDSENDASDSSSSSVDGEDKSADQKQHCASITETVRKIELEHAQNNRVKSFQCYCDEEGVVLAQARDSTCQAYERIR